MMLSAHCTACSETRECAAIFSRGQWNRFCKCIGHAMFWLCITSLRHWLISIHLFSTRSDWFHDEWRKRFSIYFSQQNHRSIEHSSGWWCMFKANADRVGNGSLLDDWRPHITWSKQCRLVESSQTRVFVLLFEFSYNKNDWKQETSIQLIIRDRMR